MRLCIVSTLLAVFSIAVAAKAPAPQPGLHQVSNQELRVRAQYPDLFSKRADPETSSTTTECEGRRKRRNFNEVEGVLNAKDTAAFLMGKGTFEWPNGTVYVDEDFAYRLERATDFQTGMARRIYNTVRDSVGNKLLTMTIPHYQRWKAGNKHGDLIFLSDLTALRAQDVDELVELLLADPNFTEIVVHGVRVDRRFFEAATAYGI